jgi:hypothetical protein
MLPFKNKPKYAGLLPWMALLCVLLNPGAVARGSECLQESPTVKAGQNPYDPIHVRELTATEYKMIRTLFQSLDKEWQGTAHKLFCRSASNPADREISDYTLRANVTVDYFGNLALEMELHSPQQHTSQQESMSFYLSEQWLRFNSDAGAGDVELIEVGTRHIAFLYRQLLPAGGGKGSVRKESFVSLTAGGGTFSINRQIYSQGRLSSESRWEFTRPQ